MDFSYAAAFHRAPGEAYEKLLLDAMRGDATLFARRDGDEQAWSLLDPLLGEQGSSEEPAAYAGGSDGPREAERLLRQDGHRWRPLAAAK
jgi:glucose-6-phosphate 1-dehydrogenase